MDNNIEKQIAFSKKVIESLLLELKNNNHLKPKITAESITKVVNRIVEATMKGGSSSVLKIILSEIVDEHYFSDKSSAPSLFIDFLTLKPSDTVSAQIEAQALIVKFKKALKQAIKPKEEVFESNKRDKNTKERKDVSTFRRGVSYRRSLVFMISLGFLLSAAFILAAISKIRTETDKGRDFQAIEETQIEDDKTGGIMTDSLRKINESRISAEKSIFNEIKTQQDFDELVSDVGKHKGLAVLVCYLNGCEPCKKIKDQIERIGKKYSDYVNFYLVCCDRDKEFSNKPRSFIQDGRQENLKFPTAVIIYKTSSPYTGPEKSEWQNIVTSSGCAYRQYVGSELCSLSSVDVNTTLGHSLEVFLKHIHKF